MIDFGVADVVQYPVQVERFERIGTFALLLAVELEFLEFAALCGDAMFGCKGGLVLLVAFALFVLRFLDFIAFVERAGQIARHLYMHGGR